MKLKVGDTVIVTAGKDKGKQAKITGVIPAANKVLMTGINMYTRSIKPMYGKAGERVRKERPLDASKVAILNPETGKADRIGYDMKDGQKVRIFKKTGKTV